MIRTELRLDTLYPSNLAKLEQSLILEIAIGNRKSWINSDKRTHTHTHVWVFSLACFSSIYSMWIYLANFWLWQFNSYPIYAGVWVCVCVCVVYVCWRKEKLRASIITVKISIQNTVGAKLYHPSPRRSRQWFISEVSEKAKLFRIFSTAKKQQYFVRFRTWTQSNQSWSEMYTILQSVKHCYCFICWFFPFNVAERKTRSNNETRFEP